ncbi:MAG: hypothetical protein M1816_003093 [Peltula sp. TS41687]|nr:MAG: hypothetical protein M1816_003093 [Peltula sp. TS41687]
MVTVTKKKNAAERRSSASTAVNPIIWQPIAGLGKENSSRSNRETNGPSRRYRGGSGRGQPRSTCSPDARRQTPTQGRWKRDSALLDPGSKLNLISQLLVKELGWQHPKESLVRLQTISETLITIYGAHIVTVRLTDSSSLTDSLVGSRRSGPLATAPDWPTDPRLPSLILAYPGR